MIVFDGHAHIYDCYELDAFFTAAFRNFKIAGEQLQTNSSISYFMLMAEATGVYYFKRLKEMAVNSENTPAFLRVERSEEAHALYVYHDDFPSMRLIIVAGRQLITKENLELLALMTDKEFDDGQELSATVKNVIETGGVPVCPWGAGKWIGQRGRVLEKYMISPDAHFFLGDSGGRPSFWPRPAIFDNEFVGQRLLSGSDPLPLVGDELRVGSYGGFVNLDCPQDKPASYLCQQLTKPGTVISPYGRLCSSTLFVKNQIALRLK
jgi:hypothetical protein